jgi:hypothetical protein
VTLLTGCIVVVHALAHNKQNLELICCYRYLALLLRCCVVVILQLFVVTFDSFLVAVSRVLLGTRYRYLVLGAVRYRYSVLRSKYSVLGTRYSVLGTRYSVLGTRYSVLGTRYSVLGTRYSVLGTVY